MPAHSDSRNAEFLYFQALDQLAADRPANAIQLFRLALEEDPAFLDAMHGLVRALRDAGEFEQAIAAAMQLTVLDPTDVLAHTSLSILYQHQGMISEAEAESLKAKLLAWRNQLREEQS